MHALLLTVALAATPAPQTWSFDAGAAPTVNVSDVNGSITIEGTETGKVTVEARQEGGADALASYPVEARQDGDTVTVRLCCGPCAEKKRNCRNPPDTHFTLRVPRGAELQISAVNAAVRVKGVGGRQEISSVNGTVELAGSKKGLKVNTVNGAVTLAPQEVAATEVSTVNGDVKLKLPAKADARVEFSTVGGSFNGKSKTLGGASQTYGAGTHEVEVSTVGGELQVEPRS
jgi:Putative adhesin